MIRWLKKYPWISLGVLALLLRLPFSWFPEFTQFFYQNGVFALYRMLWDHTLGFSPIPLVLFLLASLVFVGFKFFSTWANDQNCGNLFQALGSTAGFLVFWFYVLWGYNYHAPSMQSRMSIPESEVNQIELINLIDHTSLKAATNRAKLGEGLWQNDWVIDHPLDTLRAELEAQLRPLNYPTAGQVRCREIGAGGLMRRLGILGIYLPFVGEGHVDATQTDLTLYFSATHEMSHGYGITDEGEANFAAWLAMTQSDHPIFHYMAELELLRYLLHDLYRMDEETFTAKHAQLHDLIKSDLALIRENRMKYPGYFPEFSEAMNNLYLQSQGVESGIDSYGEFVNLALSYSTMKRLTP